MYMTIQHRSIEDQTKIKDRVGTDSVGRGWIRLDIWYRSFYCSMCVAFCRSQGDNADDGSRRGCNVRSGTVVGEAV